jgi:aspartate/methionine/tyrosine aminotransferase
LTRFKENRDRLLAGLNSTGRVLCTKPEGGFYIFCKIKGEEDSRGLALRLIDEANVGLAPGTAFGAGGANFLRICFARDSLELAEATRRLVHWLTQAK